MASRAPKGSKCNILVVDPEPPADASRGIFVEHAAPIMSHVDRLQLRTGDRVRIVCGKTFDFTVLETFGVPSVCLRLCIAFQYKILIDLAQSFIALEVTHLFIIPTLDSLLESLADVPSLRFVAFWGQPIKAQLFELWLRADDLQNTYGLAEEATSTHPRIFLAIDDLLRIGRKIGILMPFLRSCLLNLYRNLTLPDCVSQLHIGARERGRLGHLNRRYISPTSSNSLCMICTIFGDLYKTRDLFSTPPTGNRTFLGDEKTK